MNTPISGWFNLFLVRKLATVKIKYSSNYLWCWRIVKIHFCLFEARFVLSVYIFLFWLVKLIAISRKVYDSYCLIQFSKESYASFKLCIAGQSFCAWFILSDLSIRRPKFSVNMKNSPRFQAF